MISALPHARQTVRGCLARTLARLLPGLLLAGAPAWALEWQVLSAGETPAQAAFVQALRQLGTDPAQAEEEPPPVNTGVRTRSLRPRAAPAERVTVAVGPQAAREALEQPGTEPLLLAMLSRTEHEALQALPALQGGARRVGVLLSEPALAEQLALVDAVLPGRRRLGVVSTDEAGPLLRELRQAAEADARGWSLQVQTTRDPLALGAALRDVLPRSDALLVLPDAIGRNQAATLAVLRAAAGAGVPVFGSSEGIVRSGALAAAVATPAQMALQAQALGEKLATGAGASAGPVQVEAATPASVRLNPNVARSLDLRLPSEQALNERLQAPAARRP